MHADTNLHSLVAKMGQLAAEGILPDERTAALIRAALGPDDARAQWEAYVALSRYTFPNVGEFRVMPRIARFLAGHAAANQSWLDHAVTIAGEMEAELAQSDEKLRDVLGSLAIPLVATKGTALREMVYDCPADRPTSDHDFITRWDDLPRIDAALKAAGWAAKIRPKTHGERSRIMADEWSFVSPEGHEVDFSWQPRRSFVYDPSVIDWVLSGGADMPTDGVVTLPDPIWLLLECIDHGLSANVVSPIRWVVDGALIIKRYHARIDWDRIVAIAGRNRLGTLMFVGMAVLSDYADIPADTLAALERSAGAALEVDELTARLTQEDLVMNYAAGVRYNSAIRAPGAQYKLRKHSPYRAVPGLSLRARLTLARRNLVSRLID